MKLNDQPIEKLDRNEDTISVHSIFHTIQGEGPFAGRRATFIRLAGCNLACPLCDTDYTTGRAIMTPHQIVDAIGAHSQTFDHNQHLIVITGGEPFRQNITPLACLLLASRFDVQVETNGALFLDGFPYDETTIVCSPKTGNVAKELRPLIDAYKYVGGYDNLDTDGLPIRALDNKVKHRVFRPDEHYGAEIYLQPVDVQDDAENKKHLDAVVASCMEHGYRLCIQVHKLCDLE